MHKKEGTAVIFSNIHLSLILKVLLPSILCAISNLKFQTSHIKLLELFLVLELSAFLLFSSKDSSIDKGPKISLKRQKWNTTTLTFPTPITKDCFSWVNNFCIPLFGIKTVNWWGWKADLWNRRLGWKEWKQSPKLDANSFDGWSYLFIQSQRPTFQTTSQIRFKEDSFM